MKNISKLITVISLIAITHGCEVDQQNDLGFVDTSPLPDSAIDIPGDTYNIIEENPFIQVSDQPVSTFSIDADGASYANVRRFIQQDNRLPPKNAVRTEELINYFDLDYDYSDASHPIALNGEVSQCPWNVTNKLIRIGIKGKPIPENELPPSNFVFLIDVSGSMGSEDKLQLLKNGFNYFVDELKSTDKVAIVTYAGSSGVVLESTSGDQKTVIKDAINRLGSGGGTAGAAGIITAYEIAQQNFIEGGNNRVILGTDGDFNIGPSSQEELVTLIEEKRDFGIFLTTLGVGRGNYNDAALEQIANNGNGTFEYIDTIEQLRKVFIYDYSKFYTVAKDVKIQVEFSSSHVKAYRLIGYENRLLNQDDFDDDNKDAGEIGANQNITALYEIVPIATIDVKTTPTFTVDFRYKNPDESSSIGLNLDIYDQGNSFSASSDFMKFTAGVASFSMLIRDSKYKGSNAYDNVIDWIEQVHLSDPHHLKSEFSEMVKKVKGM